MENKYEQALQELKDMVYVGGTLAEADEIVKAFEELLKDYKGLKEAYNDCLNDDTYTIVLKDCRNLRKIVVEVVDGNE